MDEGIKTTGITTDEDLNRDIIITNPKLANQRQWAKIRGWKIKILAVLEHSGGMTVAEIADKLDHRRADVNTYCNRLVKEDGAIDRVDNWGFKINSLGLFLLSIKSNNTNITLTQHKHNTNITLRQLTLYPYSGFKDTDAVLALTNLLISHYNETGEKFIYISDQKLLCEKAQIPPDVLESSLLQLKQDGVAYCWWDSRANQYQFRIKPAFLERMKHI